MRMRIKTLPRQQPGVSTCVALRSVKDWGRATCPGHIFRSWVYRAQKKRGQIDFPVWRPGNRSDPAFSGETLYL